MYYQKLFDYMSNEHVNEMQATAKPNVSGELQLIEALEQYIDVLVQELNEVVVMAAVHGWRSSRFETGEQLRNKITELKSALTANNQK